MRKWRLFFLCLVIFLTARSSQAEDLNEDLLVAARNGDVESVKSLLAKGADVNAKTQYGVTALSFAAERGHFEVVKTLLEDGADPNLKDTFEGGRTPLGNAAGRGHLRVVKLLLEKGAIGKEDALWSSAFKGHLEVVKFLLDQGKASPEMLTFAYEAATQRGHNEIAELLKKAGAISNPKDKFQIDLQTLKGYEGIYRNQKGDEYKLIVEDGKLTTIDPLEEPLTLGAMDRFTFITEPPGVTFTFGLQDGKVTWFTVKLGDNSDFFKKVPEK